MNLKCKLKEIRMREFMIESKSEFAKFLNVPERTYVNWENEKSVPDLPTAFDIAEKLKRNIEDIWHR